MTLQERFEEKYIPVTESGCWLWTAYCSKDGYGKFHSNRLDNTLAHRVSYEMYKGKIPEGMQIDHLCKVRCCVNPDHLEPVTQQENIRRGETGINFRSVTHCPKGHAYDEANTSFKKSGARRCNACARIYAQLKRDELKSLKDQ